MEIASKEDFQVEEHRLNIDRAKDFGQVWEIVKDTVKEALGEYRIGMMLFLDDLPLRLGAYHPLGTNNIVLNRTLVNIVESISKSKSLVNAFVYSLLAHEYLHALGHIPEFEVRDLVYKVSSECFGEDHIVTRLAQNPWIMLKDFPLSGFDVPKRSMEIVKDFEKQNHRYIA